MYHISGEADNGTGFYVAPGGEPSTKNGSGRRIPDGEYSITNPPEGAKWRKPGVGGNVSGRGIRFHYGSGNPRNWTEGCFVLSSEYVINEHGDISYKRANSMEASRAFDTALGASEHFSYKTGKKTREGSRFPNSIKHKLILKSRAHEL